MNKRRLTRAVAVALALLTAPSMRAGARQSAGTTLHGGWAVSASPNRAFQGTWTARVASDRADAAQGTWKLLDRANRTTAEGTWSAIKTPRSWSGRWQARVTGRNQLLSGTWRTTDASPDVKTLGDLFERAVQVQVSGTFAIGRLTGSWSLRAY
jgi:hypothetical protein